MKHITLIALLSVVCLPAVSVMADTFVLEPTPKDLYDLDHYRYYTWGIDTPWDSSQMAITATLKLKNIRNWNNKPNDLYIHLLDNAPLGVTVGYDGQGGGDQFAGQGPLLVHYEDLTTTPQTLIYEFSFADLAALNLFAEDGRFALGFDPDCHYYNCGIELTITTGEIPEPATMSLLALGGLPLLSRIRRRRR